MANIEQVIDSFIYGGEDKKTPNDSIYTRRGVIYSYGEHFPMAIKLNNGFVLCNGDKYSNTTAKHQSWLFRKISNTRRVEIPFSALRQLDGIWNGGWSGRYNIEALKEIEILDHDFDKYVDTGRVNKEGEKIMQHVLGGCVFKYRGNVYLSGIDETGKGMGAYFLTQLVDNDIETVVGAFQSLKPQRVLDAEAEGIEVLRQGEWFFIAVNDLPHLYVIINANDIQKDYHLQGYVQGRTAHHKASEGLMVMGEQLVRGIVKHTGGDHKQLKLYEEGTKPKDRKWYLACENVQVTSFSASGNVD